MKINNLKNIILFFILFIYIFSPKFIFFPIDFSFIIALGSFFLLFINRGIQKIFSKYAIIICFHISFSFLFLFNEFYHFSTFNSNSYSIIFIRQVIEGILPACCFTYYLYKYRIDFIRFIKYFLIIQIIFSVLMINMDFKDFIFQKVIKLDEYAEKFSFLRNFGIARNYLSWFPSCCSFLIFILFLDYCYNKKITSLLILILSNIILLLNSRTSIIIELFCIISSYLYFCYQNKMRKKDKILKKKLSFQQKVIIIIFCFIISITVLILINLNQDFFEKIGDWLLQAVNSIGSLFGNDYQGPNTFKDLNLFYFPKESYSLLFGYGDPIYNNQISDIGYVRYVLYGGILLFFCLLIVYFEFFRIGFNGSNKQSEKMFLVIIYSSLLMLQYKGEVLSLNEITKLLFLASIYIGCSKKQE